MDPNNSVIKRLWCIFLQFYNGRRRSIWTRQRSGWTVGQHNHTVITGSAETGEELMTVQTYYNVVPDKTCFSVQNFSYFLYENVCCGYSLEVPHWGTSNEYPQHMFSLRNKKNIFLIHPSYLELSNSTVLFLIILSILIISNSRGPEYLVWDNSSLK